MKYFWWIGICCCWITAAYSQEASTNSFHQSFSFTTDNDAYLLQSNDKYYTNGLYFQYNRAGKNQTATIIHGFEAGQALYTPRLLTYYPDSVDRPYCGYLFVQYKHTRLQKKYGLQWNVAVGTIGNNSLGQNFQNGLHHTLGLYPVNDWYKQVQVPFTLNAGIRYTPFIPALAEKKSAKIVPVIELNAGNVYTNAKLGMMLVWGIYHHNENSALWDADISQLPNNNTHSFEWFVYFYPQVTLQEYNATIQGSSSNTTTTIAGTPEQWMYQQSWGMVFAKARWMSKVEIVYQTKECITQYLPQRYASLQLAYRFR